MTNEEFRAAMSAASRSDDLCWVRHNGTVQIAVGMDSSKGVAILHPKREVPMSEIEPMTGDTADLPILRTIDATDQVMNDPSVEKG